MPRQPTTMPRLCVGGLLHRRIPFLSWRSGWDSNPRASYPATAFPVLLLRPTRTPLRAKPIIARGLRARQRASARASNHESTKSGKTRNWNRESPRVRNPEQTPFGISVFRAFAMENSIRAFVMRKALPARTASRRAGTCASPSPSSASASRRSQRSSGPSSRRGNTASARRSRTGPAEPDRR